MAVNQILLPDLVRLQKQPHLEAVKEGVLGLAGQEPALDLELVDDGLEGVGLFPGQLGEDLAVEL